MAREILLSYSSEDGERVAELVRALEDEDYAVWWSRDIGAGQKWEPVLQSKIESVDCIVVAWTPAAAASSWVRAEARVAVQRKMLVPVRLEACEIPADFDGYQAIDLRDWRAGDGDGLRELLTAIRDAYTLQDGLDRVGEALLDAERTFDDFDFDMTLARAEEGDSEAQMRLADAYYFGVGGVDRNREESVEWWKRAAGAGEAYAMTMLGRLTEDENKAEAIEWFDRAAQAGDIAAAENLAWIYENGDGVRKNLRLAQRYSRLAEELTREQAAGDGEAFDEADRDSRSLDDPERPAGGERLRVNVGGVGILTASPVGSVTHYFEGKGVAAVFLTGELAKGDLVLIRGDETRFTQHARSIQRDHRNVSHAREGSEIGLEVGRPARPGDIVYRLEE